MDVCSLNGVHSRADGKEYILELNEDEDLMHLRELVLYRMTQAFPLPQTSRSDSDDEAGIGDVVYDEAESVDALKEKLAKLQVQLP
jgi:hypothetical protein